MNFIKNFILVLIFSIVGSIQIAAAEDTPLKWKYDFCKAECESVSDTDVSRCMNISEGCSITEKEACIEEENQCYYEAEQRYLSCVKYCADSLNMAVKFQ